MKLSAVARLFFPRAAVACDLASLPVSLSVALHSPLLSPLFGPLRTSTGVE
jgi:hypothetical protein